MPFKKELLAFLFSLTVITGGHVFAAIDYQLLTPVDNIVSKTDVGPDGKPRSFTDINTFVPGLIKLAIGVAGGLAVIYIMVGGIQYMTTDAYTSKKSARETIEHAIFGLLLAIGAYAILYTVNPNLLKFNFEIQGLKGGEGINTDFSAFTKKDAVALGCKNDCVPIDTNVPIKSTGPICSNDPCYVNSTLVSKLQSMNKDLAGKVDWKVTEAYPPTVPHEDPCHKPDNEQTGKCVDTTLANYSVENITTFVKAMNGAGLTSYSIEICDDTKRNMLLNSSLSSAVKLQITCYKTTNANNIHINL